jgi:hypothetical protein
VEPFDAAIEALVKQVQPGESRHEQ